MAKLGRKFTITGMVQMVGFRYHTAHEGLKLGLRGYAKNLNDGSVEVVACGEEASLARLEQWLRVGPRTARVEGLHSEPYEFRHYPNFDIL